MKLPASVRHFALTAIAATTLTGTIFLTPALAQDAVLRGSTPTSEINLRADPSTSAPILGYGVSGDRVQILRQTRGQDGNTWYQVRFYETNATGWIRSDFLTVQNTSNNPQEQALRICETRVRQQFPNTRVQVTYDPRDRSGLYRINWTTSNGDSGFCRVDRDGTLVSFVRGSDNTGTIPDRNQEARRRQLEAEFNDQLVGLTRDQAVRILTLDGYQPSDDRVGNISFSVDRQTFQAVATYDRRTRRIQRVQVSSQIVQPPRPPQNDARARQLEAQISNLVLGQFYDEAILILRDEGYTPVDDGRGAITFTADRGRYPVTVSYNTQTERVNRVRVGSNSIPPDNGNTPNETLVTFQTPTYAVRVFRRNGQLLMNVFNQQTRVQELSEVTTTREDFEGGFTYRATRGDRTYFARVADNFFALDIFAGNRQIVGERGTRNVQDAGSQRQG